MKDIRNRFIYNLLICILYCQKFAYKFVISLILISFFLVLLINNNGNIQIANASWYNSDPNWHYRQKLTLSNSGSAISDYQLAIDEASIARWEFDDGSGSTVDDNGGYVLDGTITGLGSGITWNNSGKYGKALNFDGTDTNYVSMGNPTLLNPNSKNFTISAWFKTSSSNQMRIVSKGLNSYSTGYMLEINNGYIRAGIGSGTDSNSLQFGTTSTYNDDVWHHVIATYNIVTAKSYIYIDGTVNNLEKYDSSTCGSVSGNTSFDFTDCKGDITLISTSNFYVGRYDGSALYPWNGSIDEVRLYNKYFSATEADYLYDNNTSPVLQSHIYSNVLESGADFRFTTSDGKTNIPYYLEKFTADGQNARIWLKVSSIPNGDSDIYIYYGNASAVSASSAANTFSVYDDFGDESIGSVWNSQSGEGTITESSSDTLDFSYSGTDTDWWSDGREVTALELASLPSGDFWAQIKLNSYTVNSSTMAGIAIYQDDSNVYMFGREHDGTNSRFQVDKIGTYNLSNYDTTTLPAYLAIWKESSSYAFYMSFDQFNWRKVSNTYSDITFNHIVLFGKSWNSNSLAFSMDDFFIRKTLATPPTIAINGSNENSESQIEFTIEGVSSGATNNGVTTTSETTYNRVDFGKLDFGEPEYAAQKLTIKCNAVHGYTVKVKLDGYIQGLYPANKIDPFGATNVSWETPQSWVGPDGDTPNSDTGWIGANTSDMRVSGWSSTSGKFGPISSTAHTVMYHNDQDSGTSAYVSYAMEVNQLQPPDSYAGELIYSVVPTY